MNMMLLTGIMALNVAICWWCARLAGMVWVEARVLGGLPRVMAWAAAGQAVCGFTLVVAILGMHAVQPALLVSPRTGHAVWSMVDTSIILPMLGAGLAAAAYCWILDRRESALAAMDPVRRQAFEQARTHYKAINGAPHALLLACGFVGTVKHKRQDRVESLMTLGAIALGVVLCMVSGLLLTRSIILASAGTLPGPGKVGYTAAKAVGPATPEWDTLTDSTESSAFA